MKKIIPIAILVICGLGCSVSTFAKQGPPFDPAKLTVYLHNETVNEFTGITGNVPKYVNVAYPAGLFDLKPHTTMTIELTPKYPKQHNTQEESVQISPEAANGNGACDFMINNIMAGADSSGNPQIGVFHGVIQADGGNSEGAASANAYSCVARPLYNQPSGRVIELDIVPYTPPTA